MPEQEQPDDEDEEADAERAKQELEQLRRAAELNQFKDAPFIEHLKRQMNLDKLY